MPTHDSISRRLARLKQTQAAHGDHGTRFVVHYTRNWHGGETVDLSDPDFDDPAWDTYRRATEPREDPAAIEAAVAEIRAEAIAANAPPGWVLYVRMAEDGSGAVECCGAPWWPETPRGEAASHGWHPDECWRRYPRRDTR